MAMMTRTELTDNLVFFSALHMLKRLQENEILTEDEAEDVRRGLKQRLCTTV